MIDAISSLVGTMGASGTDALRGPQLGAAGAGAGAVDGDFGQMLAEVAGNAVQTLKSAEQTSTQGIQGKASTQQVVEAVMSAQETLQSAIAIRDKLVSAFQEVSRMAI